MIDVNDGIQNQINLSCKQLKSTLSLMGVDLSASNPNEVSALEEVLLSLKDMGDESALSGASFMVGAYLGELLRQRLGGEFSVSSDNLLILDLGKTKLFPVERVRKFLEKPDENGLDLYISTLLTRK